MRKKIDREVKEWIIKEAYSQIDKLGTGNDTAEKHLNHFKQWLEMRKEIEGVSVYDNTDFTIKFRDGTRVGILLNRRETYG